MSERELSSLLRDHLADEPPVGILSGEAISTASRQGRRRLLVGGAAGLGVLAVVAALVAPSLGGDDGPSRGTEVAPATQQGMAVPGVLESLAATQVEPYVGALGAPTWDVLDVEGQPVEASDETAQYFELGYAPAESALVQLHVGGFAPPEWDTYDFDATCSGSQADGFSVSCQQETLPDGSLLISSTAPYTNLTNTTKRLITVQEALADPTHVLWARSYSITTRDGVVAGIAEYVAADSPETADWKIPVEVLRAVATDPRLLDPTGVAHAAVAETTAP